MAWELLSNAASRGALDQDHPGAPPVLQNRLEKFPQPHSCACAGVRGLRISSPPPHPTPAQTRDGFLKGTHWRDPGTQFYETAATCPAHCPRYSGWEPGSNSRQILEQGHCPPPRRDVLVRAAGVSNAWQRYGNVRSRIRLLAHVCARSPVSTGETPGGPSPQTGAGGTGGVAPAVWDVSPSLLSSHF